MFQLALIYEKLGDPRATVLLDRLVRDYSGVEPVASRAKARLKARQAEPPPPFASVSLDENYELGSPDGRLVVYHRSADEWGQLFVKDLAAGIERLLIDAPGSTVSNLAWSPDSKKLAYNFGSADNLVNEIRIADVCHRRVQVRRHDGLSNGMDGRRATSCSTDRTSRLGPPTGGSWRPAAESRAWFWPLPSERAHLLSL